MVQDHFEQWLKVEVWHLPQWYTRREIAEQCGVSKSPSFLGVLENAVKEGKLETFRGLDEHRRPVIKYKIADEYREGIFDLVNVGIKEVYEKHE